jgi:hypothetical protein
LRERLNSVAQCIYIFTELKIKSWQVHMASPKND